MLDLATIDVILAERYLPHDSMQRMQFPGWPTPLCLQLDQSFTSVKLGKMSASTPPNTFFHFCGPTSKNMQNTKTTKKNMIILQTQNS